MRMLSREKSEAFLEDMRKLARAENATPEYKAVYKIMQLALSSHLESDANNLMNDRFISEYCAPLRTIAKDPDLIDTIETRLKGQFDRYFRSTGQELNPPRP